MNTSDFYRRFEDDLRRVQGIAIAAALASGDAIVHVAGKTGTPARQFDIAAHSVLETLCSQMDLGEDTIVHVITEETPDFELVTSRLAEAVVDEPDRPRFVFLFDPVDGSMQYLKAGVGWCTAGLATSWIPTTQRWELVWAAIMLPGGRDAVWLRHGISSTLRDLPSATVVDTVALNDFRRRDDGTEMLQALDELEWVKYRLSSGGNPIAVAIARSSESVMVQPMTSKPHDAIGTLILSNLDNDVYDLTDSSGDPVPAATVQDWFSDPTQCHDPDRVPPHVVGPPVEATRSVWEVLTPIVLRRPV